jgi:hypothetical protein
MERFKDCRPARMSSGYYYLIRDLGPVKGGKGLRHHEVVLELSWQGLLRLLKSVARPKRTGDGAGPETAIGTGAGRLMRILRWTTLRT